MATKRQTKEYPAWICYECGVKFGRSEIGVATWHPDICGVCGKHAACTEPRDFGHLKDGWDSEAFQEQPCLIHLGRGTGNTHADEIKSLGLKVGDVIRGREGGDIPGRSWWYEVRLTVLWVGEKQVVYRKQWRANHHPDGWHDDGEVANFSLSCREYYLETNSTNE